VPSTPFVVPPLLLIAVLVVSGVAKLRVPDDTVSVFEKLRLPGFLLRMQAPRILPFAELTLATMLFFLPAGWYVVATTLALALFATYLVVIARALGFGYPIICGCFGRLGLGWVTRQTVVRNAVLLGVAAIVWVDSWRGEVVLQRLADAGSEGWWWLAAVLLAMVTTALVVREGKMPAPAPPPEDEYVARPVPYLVVDGPEGPGAIWRLSDTAARLLVFWDPTAEATAALPERLPEWRRRLEPVQVHLVTQSEWSQAVAVVPHLAADLLGDPEGEARQRLGVWEMPGAVLLGTDRLLAGGPVTGLAEIEELVEAAGEELRAAREETADESPDPEPADVDSSAVSEPIRRQ
jgi:hypothetical protein